MTPLRLLAAIATALACNAAAAHAQHMDKALFLEMATSGDVEKEALLLVYLRGALNGLESANMFLKRRASKPLFCTPAEPAIEPSLMLDNMIDYLRRYPDIPETTSITVTLTFALQELYPCDEDT